MELSNLQIYSRRIALDQMQTVPGMYSRETHLGEGRWPLSGVGKILAVRTIVGGFCERDERADFGFVTGGMVLRGFQQIGDGAQTAHDVRGQRRVGQHVADETVRLPDNGRLIAGGRRLETGKRGDISLLRT
jgi:hypothetical protein